MATISNGERVRSTRLKMAWSQEQLAEISGVSVRTIQRVEQGGIASLETANALSAAMGVPVNTFFDPIDCRSEKTSGNLVKRITPLTVLKDIGPVIDQYLGLGVSLIETGDRGCVGLDAGGSYLILMSEEYMRGDFHLGAVALLVGKTIPYIYVSSISEVLGALSETAHLVQQVETRAGTTEALLVNGDRYLILAMKGAYQGC